MIWIREPEREPERVPKRKSERKSERKRERKSEREIEREKDIVSFSPPFKGKLSLFGGSYKFFGPLPPPPKNPKAPWGNFFSLGGSPPVLGEAKKPWS
jgi:hypothetical protein